MENAGAAQAPVDVAAPAPTTACADAAAAPEPHKTTPKRKRQLCSPAEVDAMRPPRLSPEPQDDPEAAKRVKEKNRLRLYRFNKSLEKRKSSDGGTSEAELGEDAPSPPPSPAKPAPKPAVVAVSRPVAVPGGVSKPPPKPQAGRPATLDVAPKPPLSPAPSKGKDDGDQNTKPGARAPPRLSPEPEGATPQEAKRIRAKNRLRLYRYRQAQKKLAGGDGSGSPPPDSDYESEPEEEAPLPAEDPEASARRAFHRYQEGMPDFGRSSDPIMGALGQLDAATLAAMAQMSSGGMLHPGLAQQHGLTFPAAAAQRFDGPAPQQEAAPKKVPKVPKPPRMSPEPEDPKEAKRVRSKNRVRMHRYHQSVAAAQAAAEDKPPAVPSSMTSALQMAAAQPPPFNTPYQFPGFPEMPGRGEDWRSLAERQQQTMRLSSFLQDADMLMMRPNFRASDPGSLAASLQEPPAKRQATGKAKGKGKAAATFAAPLEESFPVSLQTVPFGEMTPVLRELALDTYIKETMGMANSLQQLEEQLKVAVRHGDTGLQSTALLAAVSQLREDSLGLSRLRMQQYADLVQQSTSVVGKAIMKSKRRSAPGDVAP